MLGKARGKNFVGNIEFVCCDISDTHISPETFDLRSAIRVSHFKEKTIALEIKRVLKGGKLFICHTSSRCDINEMKYIKRYRN